VAISHISAALKEVPRAPLNSIMKTSWKGKPTIMAERNPLMRRLIIAIKV
jgi:hypothetical protein